MIMFFLPWWTYVLIGTAAFTCSYAGIWLANIAEPGIKQDDEDGPFPCFAHMLTDEYGNERWCWLQLGHDSGHVSQFELPDTAFTREWPEESGEVPCQCHDEEGYSIGSLPQLLADGEDLEYVSPGVYKIVPESLPPLPQRLSKVPVQGSPAAPTLCTWGEDGGGNDSACWKPEGHTGSHMVQDTSRYDD